VTGVHWIMPDGRAISWPVHRQCERWFALETQAVQAMEPTDWFTRAYHFVRAYQFAPH